jgi:hypothetical protein
MVQEVVQGNVDVVDTHPRQHCEAARVCGKTPMRDELREPLRVRGDARRIDLGVSQSELPADQACRARRDSPAAIEEAGDGGMVYAEVARECAKGISGVAGPAAFELVADSFAKVHVGRR